VSPATKRLSSAVPSNGAAETRKRGGRWGGPSLAMMSWNGRGSSSPPAAAHWGGGDVVHGGAPVEEEREVSEALPRRRKARGAASSPGETQRGGGFVWTRRGRRAAQYGEAAGGALCSACAPTGGRRLARGPGRN
jgi:hypothetical protein